MADILGFITHHGTQNWWALCTRQPLGRPGERGLEPWGTLHSLLGEHEALREPTPRPLLGPPRAVVPISEPLFWPSLETGNLGRIKGWVVPPDPLTSLTWSPGSWDGRKGSSEGSIPDALEQHPASSFPLVGALPVATASPPATLPYILPALLPPQASSSPTQHPGCFPGPTATARLPPPFCRGTGFHCPGCEHSQEVFTSPFVGQAQDGVLYKD